MGNAVPLDDLPGDVAKALPFNSRALDDHAAKLEQQYGLPTGLLRSIKNDGERSNTNQVSPKGARGVMQFMPDTAKEYGLSDPTDPIQALDAAARYLVKAQGVTGSKDPAVLAAAYNGGMNRGILKTGGIPDIPETKAYAARVQAGVGKYSAPAAKLVPADDLPDVPKQEGKPAPSKDYQEGRGAPGWKQGLASVVNGPLMGFGDEVLGGAGAVIDKIKNPDSDLGANYTANRDAVRGMQDAQREENPWTTGITQAMAAAPMLVLNPLGKAAGAAYNALPQALQAARAAPAVSGIVSNTARAAGTGLGYGAVQGVGDSRAETVGGVVVDGAKTGLASAALAGVASPVAAIVGAGAKNIGQRFSQSQAAEAAKQKIAEALSRDARGEVFTSGQSNPAVQALKRFDKLGAEATVTDAGGRNTNQLLDTLATLPGRTKNAAEQAIHTRQASRSGRLVAAAEDGLSTQGERLGPNLTQWITDRQTSSAPLYQQLRQTSVTPSANLQALVASADELGAVKLGREMATARQQSFSLDTAPQQRNGLMNHGGQNWTMGDLDHVKQGLDQKIAKQWDAVEGKLTPLGAAYQDLKNKLVTELDTATVNPNTGASLYKSARDAFSGPSALIDASRQGKLALNKDGVSIADVLSPMSASEQQAFRLGAFEALRNKLGKESGQTEILKMWKEPATREKLSSIFGNEANFRQFSADVAKEARLKGLESVGRGAQTAGRQYGAGDLDSAALAEAGTAVGAAKTGALAVAAGAAKSAWNHVATPQTVRDEMGGLLLSKGAAGRQKIEDLTGLVQRINDQNATFSQGVGVAGSQIGSRLAPPMRMPAGSAAGQTTEAGTDAQASFSSAAPHINVQVPPSALQPPANSSAPEEMPAQQAPATFAPDAQPDAGELGAAAMPAQEHISPGLYSSMRPDGTLALMGDPQALHDTLIAAGIPAGSIVRNNAGVMVGRNQAAGAQEAIARMQQPEPANAAASEPPAEPVEMTAENWQTPMDVVEQTAPGQAAPLMADQEQTAATPDGRIEPTMASAAPVLTPDVHPTVSTADAMVAELATAAGIPLETVLPQNTAPPQATIAPQAINSVATTVPDTDQAVAMALAEASSRPKTEKEARARRAQLQGAAAPEIAQAAAPRTEKEARARHAQFQENQVVAQSEPEHGAIENEALKALAPAGVQAETASMQAAAPAGPGAESLPAVGVEPSHPPALASIQRLHDAGETQVAGMLQRAHDREQTLGAAQSELVGMRETAPDLPHHQNADFQKAYEQQRLAGTKPAEAAGRAGILAAVQAMASAGIPETAVASLLDELESMPLDEAPGFAQRFTQALIAKGGLPDFKGADQIEQMLEHARDGSMHAMVQAVYRENSVSA